MRDDYQGRSFATGATEAFSAQASFVPTAAAYGPGDIMGSTQEMLFLNRRNKLVQEGSIIRVLSAVVKIGVAEVPSGQTGYRLQCFSVTPPSAQGDNDLWTLAAGDLDAYLGSIDLGSPVDVGGALYVKTQGVDTDLRLITGSMFTRLVTNGGHTAAAVARSVILHGVVL
jgi:hypothetical protein